MGPNGADGGNETGGQGRGGDWRVEYYHGKLVMAEVEKITGRALKHRDRLVKAFRQDEASWTAQIKQAMVDWAIEEMIGAGQTYGQVADTLCQRGI